jgi:hypothetical protein
MLPPEIWLMIIDTLGTSGHLRDMTNLIKALKYDNTLGDKYRVIELMKSRLKGRKEDYNQKMIELWERTGIDDGVPAKYLLTRLNNKTRMYRTMWSYEVYKHKDGTYALFDSWVFDVVGGSHEYKEKYTYCIIEDRRMKPSSIETWDCNFATKARKQLSNYLVNFRKRKMIDGNRYFHLYPKIFNEWSS